MINETKLVMFEDEENITSFGIMVNQKEVICACCGNVFKIGEDCRIIKRLPNWVNFKSTIKEDA